MTQATVIAPAPARRGHAHINRMLDYILRKSGKWTTDKLADRIARDGVIGHPDSVDNSPVGLWVVGQLEAVGVAATSYAWVTGLEVYSGKYLIGEVRVPEGHTMYDLDAEINGLDRPELTWQGEGDQR